jgi:ATP-dependent RNA helicase DeaD
VLDLEAPAAAIIFCRTRTEVDALSETLSARGYPSEPLHGGMTQEQRDRVMKRVRAGTTELLIATDVAARGLDIDRLTHVVNYDLPNAPEAYVHRIGRVGRAGREGVAITFVEPREHHLLRNIERITKQKIDIAKVPSVADLQARKLELTQASLREAIQSEDKEQYRVVVDALSDEFDLVEIALAAVKLFHQTTVGEAPPESGVPAAEPQPAPSPFGARPPRPRGMDSGMAKLFINAGREAGIRPQDLVGAISNEAGVTGKSIGAITITDRYSLVEVSEDDAEKVIRALRNTKLRGKKVSVRRDGMSE